MAISLGIALHHRRTAIVSLVVRNSFRCRWKRYTRLAEKSNTDNRIIADLAAIGEKAGVRGHAWAGSGSRKSNHL